MKVLVGKTFHFVDHIWMAYVHSLRQHTGYTWLSSYCSVDITYSFTTDISVQCKY